MMQEPQQNKYRLKPKNKLQSRYLVQQEMKKKDNKSAQVICRSDNVSFEARIRNSLHSI